MEKKLTFISLAEKIMEEMKRPLSPSEIWDIAVEKGYDKLVQSKGQTPARTIGARIYVDMDTNPNTQFVKVGTRPRRFYLAKYNSSTIEELVVEQKKEKLKIKERDIHPFLTYFAFNYMNIYTKTIYHEKSKKGSYNQWLHPDIVGCYIPVDDFEKEILDFSLATGNNSIKLYSFEMKIELNFTNLREAFFQTVSNSSWAHEGYLVAAEIEQNNDFMEELRRLSTSFGIGIIQLDIMEPDNSKVIFPAKVKEVLDWDTMNKLAGQNPDYKEFIKRITSDMQSKEVYREKYDKVYKNPDEVINLLNLGRHIE